MSYAYLFKYIIIGDTGKCDSCEDLGRPNGEVKYIDLNLQLEKCVRNLIYWLFRSWKIVSSFAIH